MVNRSVNLYFRTSANINKCVNVATHVKYSLTGNGLSPPMKHLITCMLAISFLIAGEYYTEQQLIHSLVALNAENLLFDLLAFTIALTLAGMVVKIVEPLEPS